MIIQKHEISIEEIPEEVYNQTKSRQKIKPTTVGKPGAIFGKILSRISYSTRNFCKQVEEDIWKLNR